MKKLRYVGNDNDLQIAATGQTVNPGDVVEVEDDALAKSLLEQPDNWQTAGKEK